MENDDRYDDFIYIYIHTCMCVCVCKSIYGVIGRDEAGRKTYFKRRSVEEYEERFAPNDGMDVFQNTGD